MKDAIYTIQEAAERLKVSKPTIYKLFRDGKLKFFMVAGRRRITESQIAEFIDGQNNLEETGTDCDNV